LEVIDMRYRYACALAALIAAAGCGRTAIEKQLGVEVYPGAKLTASGTSATLCTASFETDATLKDVDAFYARELGPNAVRTVHTSSRADQGVRFILDKPAGEQIVVVVVRRKQSAVTQLTMAHRLPKQ
jgi:predicted small lipoprotein YifL